MNKPLVIALVASLALFGYQRREEIKTTVEDFMIPRGIRNNNPGNIRHSGNQWQGMAAQQTDAAFVQFISPEYGIRALSKLLDTYASRYGVDTVRKIISKYAPNTENNTEAYVNSVARALGVQPDTIISLTQHKAALVAAIIEHENGAQPYTLAQINTGTTMA